MRTARLKVENGGLHMYDTVLGEAKNWLAPGVRFYLTGEETETKTTLWARGFYYDIENRPIMGWVAKRFLDIDPLTHDDIILSSNKTPFRWFDLAISVGIPALAALLGWTFYVVFR